MFSNKKKHLLNSYNSIKIKGTISLFEKKNITEVIEVIVRLS